jgi:hypothetical protein
MKYFQTWQDFMRDPANKALKESKGIHACKQKFIQEQNKMQWYDPMIIQETNSPGVAVNNAVSADGGSTQFVTGNTAEVTTLTWAANISSSITASANFDIVVDVLTSGHGSDFASNHTTSRKRILLAFCTGSNQKAIDDGVSIADDIDWVVTASSTNVPMATAGPYFGISGSWSNLMAANVAKTAQGSIVLGHTNPSDGYDITTLVSVTTGSLGAGGTLTITNDIKGSVPSASLVLRSFATTTASLSTTTDGIDQFKGDNGQTFKTITDQGAANLPYSNYPRSF